MGAIRLHRASDDKNRWINLMRTDHWPVGWLHDCYVSSVSIIDKVGRYSDIAAGYRGQSHDECMPLFLHGFKSPGSGKAEDSVEFELYKQMRTRTYRSKHEYNHEMIRVAKMTGSA